VERSIETRELITVALGGMRLRGTYHRAQEYGSSLWPERGDGGTGVLFVNAGFAPRSSGGDTAASWADAFSTLGYPSFRFDMPGLGDSDGDLPAKWLDLSRLINDGCFAPVVSQIVENLVQRFGLSGVVLVGHCAGAVTATYGAAASKHVKGLVTLDTYYFREEPPRPQIRAEISRLAERNRLVGKLGIVYGHLKRLVMRARGNRLPENANVPLLRCWANLASRGLPILVLNAGGQRLSPGEFDYLGYLQKVSGRGSRIVVKSIEDANHSLADDVGRAAVRRHCEQWLNFHFPLIEREKASVPSNAQPSLSGGRREIENSWSMEGMGRVRGSR
jgi:pimeloyl-ACP methyl ester carboxylesterase